MFQKVVIFIVTVLRASDLPSVINLRKQPEKEACSLWSILNTTLRTVCYFLCGPVCMRIRSGWTICVWIIARYTVWAQAGNQNTGDKANNYSLTTKNSFGIKSSLNPRHLGSSQRCCCRLESASQITAESIATMVVVVGLSWLRDARISPY
jgi:hypothetical protein